MRTALALLGLGLTLACAAPPEDADEREDRNQFEDGWLLDDDDSQDDEDCPLMLTQTSFGAVFNVNCDAPAGDDDDSSGDDDDSSGDDDDSAPEPPLEAVCALEARMSVRFWIDHASGQLNCEQVLVGSGTISLGAGAAVDFADSTTRARSCRPACTRRWAPTTA